MNESNAKSEILVFVLGNNASEAAIASDATGNIYVVYIEHNANKTADVYLQKFLEMELCRQRRLAVKNCLSRSSEPKMKKMRFG